MIDLSALPVREIVGWLVLGSLVALVVSAIAIPVALTRMPADYFIRDPARNFGRRHPVIRFLKNALGVTFTLIGLVMLFTPGQGLLMIFVGLTLTEYPGKRELELRIVRSPAIRKAIDGLRARWDHPPIELPSDPRVP